MISHQPFSITAQCYDSLYQQKNYFRETQILDTLIHLHKGKGNTLLDMGCGTGKHCIEFAKRGYQVTGIDRSFEMLSIARKQIAGRGLSCKWIQKDITYYRSVKKFHTVVSLFHVLSYQTTDDAVNNYFSSASHALESGGLFIFDCWYGPGVFLLSPNNTTRSFTTNGAVFKRNKKSVWDVHNNIVQVYHSITVGHQKAKIYELHTMRYFFLPEIITYLSRNKFKLIEWGSLASPLTPMDKPKWDVWFIAKKF